MIFHGENGAAAGANVTTMPVVELIRIREVADLRKISGDEFLMRGVPLVEVGFEFVERGDIRSDAMSGPVGLRAEAVDLG